MVTMEENKVNTPVWRVSRTLISDNKVWTWVLMSVERKLKASFSFNTLLVFFLFFFFFTK